MFKDRAAVKLTVTDIFNAMMFGQTVNYKGLYYRSSNKPETRLVKVYFSYALGGKEVKGARNRKTGTETEQNRIKF
jgi:hypothetical protein